MKRNTRNATPATAIAIRCAVYTRKSTEEGLEQEFNSLDAQREAGENYVKSQAGEGWTLLPEFYDDGGFTGGNMDRPALKRLMADIAAGKIDVVVVYKVDRLSRSLLDFAQMMQSFEKHKVSFVSVTQQFNTATSMGRLVLNVLLSFAQFEREIISERTRDKIAATRRKGKWTGGWPILGYDVDPQGFKLVVNAAEAERVRAIFQLYIEHGSLLPVVLILNERGWINKRWKTRKAGEKGCKPFTRTSLYKLLTNVAYIGKVRYKDEVHAGEHAGIIELAVWQQVQAQLERNGRSGGAPVRNKFGAWLKGIMRCVPCDSAMIPTHTTKDETKRYRYYVCCSAQKRGWHTCPSKSVPAGQIEALVLRQIQSIGKDPKLLAEVLEQVHSQDDAHVAGLIGEQRHLECELRVWHEQMQMFSGKIRPGDDNGPILSRLADLQERIAAGEERVRSLRSEIETTERQTRNDEDAVETLSIFEPAWQSLTPREQMRIVHLLVEQVDYDGARGKVSIAFRPTGIKMLAGELANQRNGATP